MKGPRKKKNNCLCTFIQLMPFALTWHLLVLHHLMAAAENCISNGLYFIFSTWFLDSSKSQYCRLWPPPCCEMSSSSFTPWRHQHLDFFFFLFANIALTIYIYLSTVHCSHVPRDHWNTAERGCMEKKINKMNFFFPQHFYMYYMLPETYWAFIYIQMV